jgi:thiamine biosynthesis lipoprotein
MKKKTGLLKKIIAFVLLISLFISCGKQKQYYLSQGNVFHTSYHIKYEYTEPLDEKIIDELNKFDLSLNPFNKQSVIYKVNYNKNVEVDDFFINVFLKAREVSEKSNGAFDITCAPFINLWGFGFNKMDSITPQLVDSLKKYVGYEKIRLNGRKIEKDDPNIIINASAIAKGYSSDVIAQLLESHGIVNYMVEIGGEIRMKGKNPNQACWKIELTKPIDDNTGTLSERQEVVQICEGALATSGNYRNYYIKDGKKYTHTIDPRTGYPAEQNILSATVIAPDCITADAYATAFMTMGLEKASQLGNSLSELAYYFVYRDDEGNHQVKYSKNMQQYLVK